MKVFYIVNMFFPACVECPFCFPQSTFGRNHHTVRNIPRLDVQKGGQDIFHFEVLSPIVRIGLKNALIL